MQIRSQCFGEKGVILGGWLFVIQRPPPLWTCPCTCGSIHAHRDLPMKTWICSCKHGSAHENMDLPMQRWICPCTHGSAHANMDLGP
uniref:Uncharacterized protein n=1 Tax=Zosterops lateralis melanops TaxID=1220523 RepID=A0A8D2QNM2_ZOSLA